MSLVLLKKQLELLQFMQDKGITIPEAIKQLTIEIYDHEYRKKEDSEF